MSDIVELKEDISQSPLYSEDLAPVPASGRTWNTMNLAAIWVGMAVCIPTYILASYMIKDGLGWLEALGVIFVANLLVTLPMVLNGHAGVKYGVPFPVIGRASYGTYGVHVPSIVRGLVACGWFGIQTWIGGLAIYEIGCAITGADSATGLTVGKFAGFGIFWLINIYFIWKGTESIRWLETFAAPILILIGIALIGWGVQKGGSFGAVLDQSAQLDKPAAEIIDGQIVLRPIRNVDGTLKAKEVRFGQTSVDNANWVQISDEKLTFPTALIGTNDIKVQFRNGAMESSVIVASKRGEVKSKLAKYLFWLTAMVGFWATMSLSIADITRYAKTQKEQVAGQFLGLPGTMLLYSFVGVFVTCAALIGFQDILIADDAPWDPVSLLGRFENPAVVIIAQIFMLIATLSTNIAANVIAPANAFANALPNKISFRVGGVITGIIGIVIMPWYLLDQISGLLLFVSGFLGPILGVMVGDYFFVRKTELRLADLFKVGGRYHYYSGFNLKAVIASTAGVWVALVGYFVPALSWLYTLSWFTGCLTSLVIYVVIMRNDPSI